MRREILTIKFGKHISGCCPGHDNFPIETYKNKRSKKDRSRDKKKEHRYVRRINKKFPIEV